MGRVSPVRWWRDDETRYMSRPELRAFGERRHFNLSEVPRGDNPELDAFVEHWRDTIGFRNPDFDFATTFEPMPERSPIDDIIEMRRYDVMARGWSVRDWMLFSAKDIA